MEAARLLAIKHGLGTSVPVGRRTPEAAIAVLRYHLDRLFGALANPELASGYSGWSASDIPPTATHHADSTVA